MSAFNSKFFGADHHIRRGGRGAQWSGDACVAHGGQGRSGRETGRRATQASPPFFPATPAPTRRIRFPARFTKYLLLRGGRLRRPRNQLRRPQKEKSRQSRNTIVCPYSTCLPPR